LRVHFLHSHFRSVISLCPLLAEGVVTGVELANGRGRPDQVDVGDIAPGIPAALAVPAALLNELAVAGTPSIGWG
jgi:hypothetical protein